MMCAYVCVWGCTIATRYPIVDNTITNTSTSSSYSFYYCNQVTYALGTAAEDGK